MTSIERRLLDRDARRGFGAKEGLQRHPLGLHSRLELDSAHTTAATTSGTHGRSTRRFADGDGDDLGGEQQRHAEHTVDMMLILQTYLSTLPDANSRPLW